MLKTNYSVYPTVKGLVKLRNRNNDDVFVMSTGNIRDRIEAVDKTIKKYPSNKLEWDKDVFRNWGPWRAEAVMHEIDNGYGDGLWWDYTIMPNTDYKVIESIKKVLDDESVSKTLFGNVKKGV